jgi:HD superfamily phosphohydrolase
MYWQVYLHKTVVSAEFLLINILKRAREIWATGEALFTTPTLKIFLDNNFSHDDFSENISVKGKNVLDWYALLDDNDIISSVKEWQSHSDPVLSKLSKNLINRQLFRIKLTDRPVSKNWKKKMLRQITKQITHDAQLSTYLLITGEITNSAYNRHTENIKILFKNGKVKDIGKASDINLSVLTKTVRKYFTCYPKELDIN